MWWRPVPGRAHSAPCRCRVKSQAQAGPTYHGQVFTVSHWENTYYSAAFHIGNLMLVSLLEIPKASTTLLDMSSHSESSEVCQEVKSRCDSVPRDQAPLLAKGRPDLFILIFTLKRGKQTNKSLTQNLLRAFYRNNFQKLDSSQRLPFGNNTSNTFFKGYF